MKRILITGASGFIGKRLLAKLDSGDEYFLLSRKENPESKTLPSNFKIIKGDLENIMDLSRTLKELDIIVNMAAELKDENKMNSTNIEGVKSLCHFAKKTGVQKIIHLSSVGVIGAQYSKKPLVIDEKSICNPVNAYEKTKLESERILIGFANSNKLDLVILRPTNVFGDEHPRHALLNLISRINKGRSFPLRKDAKVNYVFVDDLVSVIKHCIYNSMKDRIYIIGNPISMREFISDISFFLGKKANFTNIPGIFINLLEFVGYFGVGRVKNGFRNISNFVEYDGNKIVNETGLNYHLKDGLGRTIAHYKKTGMLE